MDQAGNPTPSSIPITVQNAEVTGEPQKEGEVEAGEMQMTEPIAVSLAAAVEIGEETDIQKKLRRAERFGMPVKLSEEEKRNTRAQRFGTGSTLHQTTASTVKLEEQKRKARVERFGIATQPTVDEEAKKKARLARFAQTPKIDPLEEEKRKARATRFEKASTASSEANDKDTFEKETTTVAGTI